MRMAGPRHRATHGRVAIRPLLLTDQNSSSTQPQSATTARIAHRARQSCHRPEGPLAHTIRFQATFRKDSNRFRRPTRHDCLQSRILGWTTSGTPPHSRSPQPRLRSWAPRHGRSRHHPHRQRPTLSLAHRAAIRRVRPNARWSRWRSSKACSLPRATPLRRTACAASPAPASRAHAARHNAGLSPPRSLRTPRAELRGETCAGDNAGTLAMAPPQFCGR